MFLLDFPLKMTRQIVVEFFRRVCYNIPTCRIRISVIQRLPKP